MGISKPGNLERGPLKIGRWGLGSDLGSPSSDPRCAAVFFPFHARAAKLFQVAGELASVRPMRRMLRDSAIADARAMISRCGAEQTDERDLIKLVLIDGDSPGVTWTGLVDSRSLGLSMR